jgi:Predicted ATPase (AAA+ superfamily)
MKVIERTEFLDKLKAYKDKQIIKVITGIRRCGKSTLMKMFMEHLLSTGVQQNQMVFLNFEDFDNYELLEPKTLHDYVKSRLVAGKKTYVFLMKYRMFEIFSG